MLAVPPIVRVIIPSGGTARVVAVHQ